MVLGEADLDVLHGKNDTNGTWTKYIPFLKRRNKHQPSELTSLAGMQLSIDKKKPVILNEENIRRFIIADCCHPIPGDTVLGYLDDHNRITIHKRHCPVAAKLKTSDGNHILAAVWDTHKKLYFPATLQLNGIDRIGVLNQITTILSQQLNVNIHKLTVETQDGIFEAEIQLEVHDVEDVQIICKNLKQIEEIEEVTRIS